MDSKSHLQNNNITTEYRDVANPIKQLHYLDGKYFIVLDKSIIDKLNLLDSDNYFSQEATTDGLIILQLVRCMDIIS
jgi:hypothetical protein